MRKINLFLSFLLVAFLVVGCDATKDATSEGEEFHELLMTENYDALAKMISEEGLKSSPEEDWINLFKQINKLGLESYKKTSFSTNIDNGVTKVTLNYTVKLKGDDDSYYEKIVFVNQGDDIKLLYYSINKDKSKL